MNNWELLFLFCAGLSLFLSILFFIRPKGDKVANRILSLYLLLFAINLCYNITYWTGLVFQEPYVHFYGFLAMIWVSYPPLMFIYVRRVVARKKLVRKDLIHIFVLFMVVLLYSRLYLLDSESKLEVLSNGTHWKYIYFAKFIKSGISVILIFYLVWAFYLVRRTEGLPNNIRNWLFWIIGAYSGYVVSIIAYFILSSLGWITIEHDYFIMTGIVFCIGLVTYFGFILPEVFDGTPLKKIVPFAKYQRSGLTSEFSLSQKERLLEVMDQHKPYLDSDLRLDDLANMISLSRNHTSQIINEHFGQSFFYFINTYRISEAMELLISDIDLSITEVIYQSGFNNRVSFYKAFKKHTGITPKEFRHQYLAEKAM